MATRDGRRGRGSGNAGARGGARRRGSAAATSHAAGHSSGSVARGAGRPGLSGGRALRAPLIHRVYSAILVDIEERNGVMTGIFTILTGLEQRRPAGASAEAGDA